MRCLLSLALVLTSAVATGALPAAAAEQSPAPAVVGLTQSQSAPALRIALSPRAIVKGQTSRVWVAGEPGERVLLYAFTSPSTTYRLVRTGTTNAVGLASWPVRPGSWTRLYAVPDGGSATRNSPSTVLEVQPRPRAVVPQHGGAYTAVYLTLSTDRRDPALGWSVAEAQQIGYEASITSLACDQGAAQALQQDEEALATVVYFPDRSAAERFTRLYPGHVSGVVDVRTFCLD